MFDFGTTRVSGRTIRKSSHVRHQSGMRKRARLWRDSDRKVCNSTVLRMTATVESRIGAVAWGLWPTPRFLSPLIELDVPISGIQLSDWLHRKAHGEEAWPQACSAADFPFAFRHSSLGRVLSLMVFSGLSPITSTSPSSKAHQKSGSFAPPALPSIVAHTTLSDSRQSRRLSRR